MAKIPLITIAGVPNTGKSTLFNRITGKRKALVHSMPGMTRDIYKETFKINEKFFYIQDSGGFFPEDNYISSEINKRVVGETGRSDLVIFLFDGKRDLLGYEKDLFLDIKKSNPNILAVVNKIDNPERYILPSSYYALKVDFIFISAEHNLNVEKIEDHISEFFKEYLNGDSTEIVEKALMKLSFMGKPNVGKSSIINKLINDEKAVVSPIPGTTRDSVDFLIKSHGNSFILTDNAGIRKLKKVKESTESAAVIRAEKDLINADIIIFIVDSSKKMDQNDFLLAKKIGKAFKPVIIVCNKWDLIKEKTDAKKLMQKIRSRFHYLYFSPVLITSALEGKNIREIIHTSEEIYKQLNRKFKTSDLIKTVRSILSERKFLSQSGEIFNPKFISIESYRPFFIKFFSGKGSRIKMSDEKYLKKRILEELGLLGIPIFFKVLPK